MDSERLPGPLIIDGNLATNWDLFEQEFNIYLTSTEKHKKSDDIKIAILLRCLGREALKVFNTFQFESEDEKKTYANVLKKFQSYCKPKLNLTYERYVFNSRSQKEGEPLDSFIAEIRALAQSCDFGNLTDSLIRDRIVCGMTSDDLRASLLRIEGLTLDKTVTICHSFEATASRMQVLSNRVANVASIQPSKPKIKCKFCGEIHILDRSHCPANNKTCNSCQGKGHFSSMCKSKLKYESRSKPNFRQKFPKHKPKKVRHVNESFESSENSDASVSFMAKSLAGIKVHCLKPVKSLNCKNGELVSINVAGNNIDFEPDTGAQVNILPLNVFNKFYPEEKVLPTSTVLVAFGGQRIKPVGKVFLKCHNDSISKLFEFILVDGAYTPILSRQACVDLNVLKFLNNVDALPGVLSEFPDLFDGKLGKIPGKVHLEIDSAATPVARPPYNVPIALRDPCKLKLQEMEADGVICSETQPTEWVSNMVLIDKNKGSNGVPNLRVCIDPTFLNKALKRSHYPYPSVEEIATRIPKDAKFFTVIDAKNGFWQLELDEQSSKLLTFSTPFGRKRYLRMPPGIKPASEIFQLKMHESFGDLEGIEIIMDDFLVWGRTEHEHDERLRNLLIKARLVGLKFSASKIKYKLSEVKFIGHIFTEGGLKADPEKISAILKMPNPSDKEDLRRILGCVNYLGKYIENLSLVTFPLRELLRDDVDWKWSSEHILAFNEVKSLLTKAPVLSYFDKDSEIVLSVDSSLYGMGAALLQNGKPVAYASTTLNKTQQRYAQIERELLAIVFGCEKFYTYIYGRKVKVESDHKPLETIFKKPLIDCPMRLQKMLMRLQKFDLNVVYKKGKLLYIADTLSRAPLPNVLEPDDSARVVLIHNVAQIALLNSDTELLKKETKADAVLSVLKKNILEGFPNSKDQLNALLSPYWSFKEQLSCSGGLIFKDYCVIIPCALRKATLKQLHKSHMGMEKTLALARDVVFWPGMCAEIRELVSLCETCNAYRKKQPKQPLLSYPPTDLPWERVSMDLFELHGKDFIILVDSYSRYMEFAELPRNTSSQSVIKFCKEVFSRHGVPTTVVCDNGSQFISREFLDFSKLWSFQLVTSSPYYHQSNGLAEKYVDVVKSLIKKAILSKGDIYESVLHYRNTPLTNGYTPAQMLFSRRCRTTLPVTNRLLQPELCDTTQIREKAEQSAYKQALHYNRGAKELPDLKPGDRVKMEPRSGGSKWTSGTVLNPTAEPRSYVVQDADGRTYRRNRRHLVKVRSREPLQRSASVLDNSLESPVMSPGDNADSCVPCVSEPSPLKTRSGKVYNRK